MACPNNSIAEHILCIALCVTWLLPVNRVGLRIDKVRCKHNFRKTKRFMCTNIVISLKPLLSLHFPLLKAVRLGCLCYRLDCLTLWDWTDSFSRNVSNLLTMYVAKHHRSSKISSQNIHFYWLNSAALFRLLILQKPSRFNKLFQFFFYIPYIRMTDIFRN